MLAGTNHRKILYHLVLGRPLPFVSRGYFFTASWEQLSFHFCSSAFNP